MISWKCNFLANVQDSISFLNKYFHSIFIVFFWSYYLIPKLHLPNATFHFIVTKPSSSKLLTIFQMVHVKHITAKQNSRNEKKKNLRFHDRKQLTSERKLGSLFCGFRIVCCRATDWLKLPKVPVPHLHSNCVLPRSNSSANVHCGPFWFSLMVYQVYSIFTIGIFTIGIIIFQFPN